MKKDETTELTAKMTNTDCSGTSAKMKKLRDAAEKDIKEALGARFLEELRNPLYQYVKAN
jgi:hypothetical protein